jgi:MFS-type transporter involved in bile tolerance (Atg22 family)
VCAQVIAAVLVAALLVPAASVTVGVLVGVGMCTAPMTAWAQTLRMRAVPPGQQGKLFALLRTVMQATPPAGAAVAGLTIGLGQAVTVLVIAAVMAVPALVLARGLVAFETTEDHPRTSIGDSDS